MYKKSTECGAFLPFRPIDKLHACQAACSSKQPKNENKSRRVSIKSFGVLTLEQLGPISQSVGKNTDSAFFVKKHIFYYTPGFFLTVRTYYGLCKYSI